MRRLLRKLKPKLTPRRRAPPDIPLTGFMTSPSGAAADGGTTPTTKDPTTPQPTYAAFSPNQQTATQQRRTQRSILIHQKSPLLVSTPPQITRALAYSHPYILPLERLAGLVAWRSGDPWESFLLLAVFWFVTLYIDAVVRWAGPVVFVAAVIVGLYTRRYSPLSSTTWASAGGGGGGKGHKHRRSGSDSSRKSLDDILNTLQTFTTNCEACIAPLRQLSEFLSTQTTPTSATTRPALTRLFVRILAFTPVWVALTLPPWRVVTTQRVVLVLGTAGLSWHSRYAVICRSILWRSRTVKRCLAFLTGLEFDRSLSQQQGTGKPPPLPPRSRSAAAAAAVADTKGKSPGVRFTFTIYENERRWLGLGWSKQMFSYERQAYTDDHLDECPAPEDYTLPDTDDGNTTQWRWVAGSPWRVEGAADGREKSAKRIGGGGGGDESGWVYCDSKWSDPRKVDGWSRYTRRRKWVRDGELVEGDAGGEGEEGVTPTASTAAANVGVGNGVMGIDDGAETSSLDTSASASAAKKRGWFKQRRKSGKIVPLAAGQGAGAGSGGGGGGDAASSTLSTESKRSRESVEDDVATPLERIRQFDWDRSLNEEMGMQLG